MMLNDLLPRKTPVSNTGSKPQKFQPVGTDAQLEVHVDWLQGTCHPMSDDFVVEAVKVVMRMLGDKEVMEWNTGSYVGKQWQHRGHSIGGVKFWWDSPGEKRTGHMLFSIPGAVCSSVSVEVIWRLSKFLHEVFDFKATRLDVAVDDYQKRLSFEELLSASRAGNFARVKKITPIFGCYKSRRIKGWTFDVGSKQSDKYGVVYDKEVESKGFIKSVRFEGRFKDELAHSIWTEWLSIPDDKFDSLSPAFLAGKAIGIVEFVERREGVSDIPRMKRLSWWKEFVDAVGSHLRHSIKKPDSTFDKAKRWVERQVSGTLAVIRKVMGVHDYRRFHDEALAKSEATFSVKDKAKIVKWSDERSSVEQRSKGVVDVIDETGQKWCWAWYQSQLGDEWRIARFYASERSEARIRFSGEKMRSVPVSWVHLGEKKPVWTPRLLNAVNHAVMQ